MSEYLKFLKSPKDEIIIPFFDTLMRSAPDSLILGTLMLSLLTQSYPYSVLLFAFIEIILSHYVLSSFISYISGAQGPDIPDRCGFQIPSYTQISILKSLLKASACPSAPTFFMASVVSYMLGSTMNMRDEIADLSKKNPILKSRFPISTVLGILFLCTYVVWRISNGCDTLMGGMGSIVLGMAVGGFFLMANSYIFGRESINFTGLPLLVSRISTGQPLYACGEVDNSEATDQTQEPVEAAAEDATTASAARPTLNNMFKSTSKTIKTNTNTITQDASGNNIVDNLKIF